MSSDQENSYFTTLEIEKMKALRRKLEAEADEKSKAELKALHYLKCGKCGHDMDTVPFRGIEIEVCTNCKAVLLDPGELQELVGEDQSGVISTLSEFFSFSKKKD